MLEDNNVTTTWGERHLKPGASGGFEMGDCVPFPPTYKNHGLFVYMCNYPQAQKVPL